MTDKELKESIKKVVISSIEKYIKNNAKKEATFHPLDYLIPKERKLRSIVGGVETSIGSTLWEPLAKTIAKLNGFEVITQKLQRPKQSMTHLANVKENIELDRLDINSAKAEDINQTLKRACQRYVDADIVFKNTTAGQGVDIWLKKDGINYLFDTKTVRPNVEKFKELFRQLIGWYSYFYTQMPLEQAECRIVFPYNPFGEKDFWAKSMKKGWPLQAHTEAWVADEFWDFLSGREGTLQLIFESFKEVKAGGKLDKGFLDLFK